MFLPCPSRLLFVPSVVRPDFMSPRLFSHAIGISFTVSLARILNGFGCNPLELPRRDYIT